MVLKLLARNQGLKPLERKTTSHLHENHQATIKTRYCGCLYSPLLRKWTHFHQRGQVSYCKERGPKKPSALDVLKGGRGFARLLFASLVDAFSEGVQLVAPSLQ